MKKLALILLTLFAFTQAFAQIPLRITNRKLVSGDSTVFKIGKIDTVTADGHLIFRDVTGTYTISDFLGAVFGQDSLARLQNQPAKTLYVSPSFVAPLTNPYFSTIQAAIDAADSGTTIFVFPSTYNLSTALIIDSTKNFLTIEGAGSSTKIVLAKNIVGSNHAAIFVNNTSNNTGTTRTSNITIRNLYIDHNGDNQSSGAGVWGAIFIKYVDYLTIQNVYVKNAHECGFNVRGCRYVTMDNCIVDRTIMGGAGNAFNVIGFNSQQTVAADYVSISNCKAIRAADFGFDLAYAGASNFTVTNCIAVACESGIFSEFGGGDIYAGKLTITGCVADSCRQGIGGQNNSVGLPDPAGDRFVFSNNIVDGKNRPNSVGIGLYDQKIVATGNQISGVQWGFYAVDNYDRIATDGYVISGNQVKLIGGITGQAIVFDKRTSGGADTSYYRNGIISGNDLDCNHQSSANAGILLKGRVKDFKILGNSVRNASGPGIHLERNTGLDAPKNIEISNNTLSGNGTFGGGYYGAGITTDFGTSRVSIFSNTSTGQDYGMYLRSGSGTWIVNNRLSGNAVSPVAYDSVLHGFAFNNMTSDAVDPQTASPPTGIRTLWDGAFGTNNHAIFGRSGENDTSSNRGLRIAQQYYTGGGLSSYIIYNGRITGADYPPTFIQGTTGKLFALQFNQDGSMNLLASSSASSGTDSIVVPTLVGTVTSNGLFIPTANFDSAYAAKLQMGGALGLLVVNTSDMENIDSPYDGQTVFNSDSAFVMTYFSGSWRGGAGGGGGGSGEINDGVNLGGGLAVYDSKSGVHLNFNTLSSTFFDLTSNVFTPKNGALTLGKMADVATGTVFYRKTAGTGSPEVQTLATLKTDLGLTGTNSGDQTITLTGPITGSGTSTIATSITDGQVALSKLPNASQFTFLGRIAAGSGARADITSAQLLSTITPTSSGFWHITSGGSDAAARAVNVASSDITGVVPIVNGGTNSSTALTGNKAMISNGSGAIVEHSTTTSTEIGYVAGVTSAIQTQLNGKQPLDGDLTAIAALSTNGLVARVASDTYAPRTLIGNTEAVVANGDGIAGNPTLTIGAPIARRSDFADSGMTVVAVPAHYMYAKNADTVTTGQLFDSVSVTGIDVANTTTAFRVRQTSSGKIAEYLSGTTRVFEILTNGHVGVAGTTIYEGSGENLTNITANSVDSVHHIYLDTTGIAAFAAKNLKCGFVYDAASGTFKMQFIPSMADTDNVGRGNVVYYYNGQFHTAPDSLGAGLTVPLPIASGGTNSTAALNSNRFMVSVAGAIIEASAIPANRVIVSDANGLPTGAAAITAARALKSDANGIPVHFDTATEPSMTELTYVKGVTSAIQTQLDAKQATLPSFYMMTQLPAGIFVNAAGDLTGATAIASDADNTNDWTMREIEFSADAQNYISTSLTMPEDWDGSTAPKFKIISYSTGSHASTVARWGIAVGYSRLATDSWVAALGTEVYATQTYTATYTPQATDIAPTPAGTAGTMCSLKIRLMRDGNNAADTFTSTTRFVRLLMQYKQNSSHGTTSSW